MSGLRRFLLLTALILQLALLQTTVVTASDDSVDDSGDHLRHHHHHHRHHHHHHRAHEVATPAPSPSATDESFVAKLHHTFNGSDSSTNGTTPQDVVNKAVNEVKHAKVGRDVIAGIAIAVGLVVCFAGYKLFRPTMFLCGFILGGLLLAGAVTAIFKSKDWVDTASWVAFLIGGLICGALVIWLYNFGIFIAGAAGGVVLGITLFTPISVKVYAAHPQVVLWVGAIALGILGGVMALKIERPLLIIVTALVGADMVVWGIGVFAGKYPTESDIDNFAKGSGKIPGEWWGYLIGMLVLFAIGATVQFKKTAHGTDHHRLRDPKGSAV